MVHTIEGLGFSAAADENISGTCIKWIPHGSGDVNVSGHALYRVATAACSFVVAQWRSGADPFCGAPTRPGSPYCARHQPVCVVPHDSAEGRLRIAALTEAAEAAPEPPRELAHLREAVLPELLPDEIEDLRAILDHPPPDPGARGSE